MKGNIYLDFNDKFKIPYANITASNEEKELKLTFKYADEFQLQMYTNGNEEVLFSYLTRSQKEIKNFLRESNLKAEKLDILFSISSLNDNLNFSSVILSETSQINIGNAEFKVLSLIHI